MPPDESGTTKASRDALDQAAPSSAAARAGRGRWRYTRLTLVLVAVIVAASVVTTVTVDLGPALRAQAEQAGSGQVGRPMHIGKLSIYLFLGRFLVEDLVIEGLTPDAPPFLRAERIVVSMPWSSLFRREVLFDSIEMTDWEMVVESFPEGRHSFPDLDGNGGDADGEPAATEEGDRANRFVTTLSYVRAHRGTFTYNDFGSDWSAVARNLDVRVAKVLDYRGSATFSDGTVQIGSFQPMTAAMQADFKVEGGKVVFDRLALQTDGADSQLTGAVDLENWPEQTYAVRSDADFPVLRDIFFADDPFTVGGAGVFEGNYHLYEGGYDLRGGFQSELMTLNDHPFPELSGSLHWRRDGFDVFDGASAFHDGLLEFDYALTSADLPDGNTARFDATYRDVDLASLTDELALAGVRLDGRATGWNRMSWERGRFSDLQGDGRLDATPREGVRLQREIRRGAIAAAVPGAVLSAAPPPFRRLSVGGSVEYALEPEWIELAPGSWVATPQSHIAFEGRTAYGGDSEIPFHVTSADWQESDQILAGLVTAFGRPTHEVEIAGVGTFDGVMRGPFSSPRVDGLFAANDLRLWDVTWGEWRGDVIVEDGYVDIADGRVVGDGSDITLDGRFAFSYPRPDDGEEINATFQITDRPATDFLAAFDQADYQIDGLVSGEFHLTGRYSAPLGFGRISIRDATAYGEPIASGSAGLRFEGNGIRLDGVEMAKGGGIITGAAFVGWDGTYTFNADGRRIPMAEMAAVQSDEAQLSGTLLFTASGVGAFEAPAYDVRGRVDGLFVAGEEVGQVTGRIGVRNEEATLEIEAASSRLAISALGRVALTPEADAELTFRFTDTSLDPYVRIFEPRLQPYTRATASGSMRVVGELGNLEHLLVDATIEQLQMALFDYDVRNEGLIRIALDQEVIRIERMQLAGEGTALDLTGELRLAADEVAVRVTGDANLGILQGFIGDIRSSGNAELVADVRGPIDAPVLTGFAAVTDGRLRLFSLPHALESANGRVTFDADGIHLDDLSATLGGGTVQFGGRIGLDGYLPGEVNVTLAGEAMQLRYPEGFRSVVDADLSLQGRFEDPVLTGIVAVTDATWTQQFEANTGFLNLADEGDTPAVDSEVESVFPMRYDIRINAPGTLRIDDRDARVAASAEFTLQGTTEAPQLLGHVEIDRGEVFFEGNRYLVTRGSVDFSDPIRIDPFFDVEAETSVRVPGQIYRVIFHAAGTTERFVPDLSSDPPLPPIDILSLLFGDVRDPTEGELRSIRGAEETEQQLLQARATQLLTSPIASGVGQVVEQSFGVDTFQITPSLSDSTSRETTELAATARLTVGKRVTDRAYLTLSRTLTGTQQDLLILLEYDQSDRLSWVLSQNEDRTYAIDFRVRHAF